MNRIAGSQGDYLWRERKRRFVPAASTALAILLGLFPLIVTAPIVPDVGFLFLITWRLLRPEIWMPTAALGLGLFDDVVSAHPIGQSMALWTMIFLALDLVESRIGHRDFWFDWLFAAVAIIFHTFGAWYIGVLMGNRIPFSMLLPQLGFSVLAYPMVARIVLGLDRWRLAR